MVKRSEKRPRRWVVYIGIALCSVIMLAVAFMYANLLLAQKAITADDADYLYDFELADTHIRLAWLVGDTDELLCDYINAGMEMINENYADAISAFQSLGGYRDSVLMTKECYLRLSEKFYNSGEYAEALALLEELEGYGNSSELIQATKYCMGSQKAESGDYLEAMHIFKTILNYNDVRALFYDTVNDYVDKSSDELKFDEAMSVLIDLKDEGIELDEQILRLDNLFVEHCMAEGDYYSAYRRLVAVGIVDERLDSCIEGAYEQAKKLYQLGDYLQCLDMLEELKEFDLLDIEKYVNLCRGWICALSLDGDDNEVISIETALIGHVTFEDTARLLVYNTAFASAFLDGEWVSDGRMLTAGWVTINNEKHPFLLDNFADASERYAIAIRDGVVCVYTDQTTFYELYRIIVIDINMIQVVCDDEEYEFMRVNTLE